MKSLKLGNALSDAGEMNEEQLRGELDKARRSLDAIKSSKTAWIMFLLAFGFLFGAWYTGQQARESSKLGYEAGVLSTDEDRAAAREKAREDQQHLLCDANGRNCVNK